MGNPEIFPTLKLGNPDINGLRRQLHLCPVNENDLIEPEFQEVSPGVNQLVGAYAVYCMQEQNKLQPGVQLNEAKTLQFGTVNNAAASGGELTGANQNRVTLIKLKFI